MTSFFRRKLKQWEKDQLWRISNGRCQICNKPLTQAHADHIEPFSTTGRTNVYELQLLCQSCNLKKGTSSMNKALPLLNQFNPDWNGYRVDQKQLHLAIIEAIRRGEKEIGVTLHIRGGKSMLIRMTVVDAIELGLVALGIAINNRSELRLQIAASERWSEDLNRLNTTVPRMPPHGFAHVKRKSTGEALVGQWPDDPWPNDEYLLSTTIQTVCSRLERVIEFIRHVNATTGLPVLLALDEAQDYGIDDDSGLVDNLSRDWAPTLQRIQTETNVILVTYSGYAKRSDGLILPGFQMIDQAESERSKWIFDQVIEKRDDGTTLIRKKLIDFKKLGFTMIPKGGLAFVVPLKRGFETNALCGLDHITISHRITIRDGSEVILDNQSLGDVNESLMRKALNFYVHDERVIEAHIRKGIERLKFKRLANSSVKILVYTSMDPPGKGGTDLHANQVKACFERLAPKLKVRILTQNTEGSSSSDVLLSFAHDDYDVLILKSIGRVGFDCPRAKILIDLSTVRAESKVAQTWLRVSTPFEGISGEIISPNDSLSVELFQTIVSENGGHHMERTIDIKVAKEKEDVLTDKNLIFECGDEEEVGVRTHDLNHVTSNQVNIIDAYLKEYPGYNPLLQQGNVAQRWNFVEMQMKHHGWQPPETLKTSEKPKAPYRYQEAWRYSAPIRRASKKATFKKTGIKKEFEDFNDSDWKVWNPMHSKLWEQARSKAGQPIDRELSQIQSLKALDIILGYFESIGNA